MNSVNWAGNTSSKNVEFRLTADKQKILGPVTIAIVTLGDKSGRGVAKELVRVWKEEHGLPVVLRIGGSVHFVTDVTKVELKEVGADDGDWAPVPSTGAAMMVPGNAGLVVWRS